MILVDIPDGFFPERKYILKVILKDFLGLDFAIRHTDLKTVTLAQANSEKKLIVEDCLFQFSSEQWLKLSSLPIQPLPRFIFPRDNLKAKLLSSQLPVIYGKPLENGNFLKIASARVHLGIDILGSAFFMLTRYEEYVKAEQDIFNRFPGYASLSYQEGFLARPIVNEYVEVLWACIKYLWPNLERQTRCFKARLSHDVDCPFQYAFTALPLLLRNLAGDLVKRASVKQGISRLRNWNHVKHGNLEDDPFNTFDWIMNLSEKHNLSSAFYFIAGHTDPKKDGNYNICHPWLRKLLRIIHEREHEIGLHCSFKTYLDSAQTQKEFEKLLRVCSEENIYQEFWGGRQHFLRWKTPYTFQNWHDAGLAYDSTLAFADQTGFRCGTCYEYQVFNLITRQVLTLVERPLIVMECTVLDERYMGLRYDIDRAYNYISNLKNVCRLFKGDFTLLWHNSRLVDPIEKELYKQILAA